jgi:hypothetical protein
MDAASRPQVLLFAGRRMVAPFYLGSLLALGLRIIEFRTDVR